MLKATKQNCTEGEQAVGASQPLHPAIPPLRLDPKDFMFSIFKTSQVNKNQATFSYLYYQYFN